MWQEISSLRHSARILLDSHLPGGPLTPIWVGIVVQGVPLSILLSQRRAVELVRCRLQHHEP